MKQKCASLSALKKDSSSLQPKTGYWLWAKEAGKLNLPAAGGTLSGETYAWNKLRFHNGTDELNITDANSQGWVNETLWTRDVIAIGRTGPVYGWVEVSSGSTLSSWKGYFIESYYDNVTLIRQN